MDINVYVNIHIREKNYGFELLMKEVIKLEEKEKKRITENTITKVKSYVPLPDLSTPPLAAMSYKEEPTNEILSTD